MRSLRKARDFERVYRSGRRASRDGLTIVVAPGAIGEPSRVGLAVPGRVGGAIVRNRVRRRLREATRACGLAPGYDVVVRASEELVGKNFQDIVRHMDAALTDAGVGG
ncbi:MAG: ribonuclease P protein component [Actinomycetota bacterium]